MAQLAAKKYATALFELAQEDGKMDTLNQEALAVLNVIKEEPKFMATLLHPQVTCDEKMKIVDKAFAGFSNDMLGFLHIVLKKNRENELTHMLQIFLESIEETKGIVNAQVTTASPLTPAQLEQIKAKLTEKMQKTVNITAIEDESLIGGICVKAGGFIFDNSVKKQLESMRTKLLG